MNSLVPEKYPGPDNKSMFALTYSVDGDKLGADD
jgi:hypothetical protein